MIVLSGFRTAWRFAGSPTRIPSFVNATTDGNILPPYVEPSALGIIFGVPPSMYAASEFVVPRSIPMILGIRITSVPHDDDLSGTQDAIVEPVPPADELFHVAVLPVCVGHALHAVHQKRVEGAPPPEPGEDGEEARDEGLVGVFHEGLRLPRCPLPEVVELRLEVLHPREELLPLFPGGFELLAEGFFRGGGSLQLPAGDVFDRSRLVGHGSSLWSWSRRPAAGPGRGEGAGS